NREFRQVVTVTNGATQSRKLCVHALIVVCASRLSATGQHCRCPNRHDRQVLPNRVSHSCQRMLKKPCCQQMCAGACLSVRRPSSEGVSPIATRGGHRRPRLRAASSAT